MKEELKAKKAAKRKAKETVESANKKLKQDLALKAASSTIISTKKFRSKVEHKFTEVEDESEATSKHFETQLKNMEKKRTIFEEMDDDVRLGEQGWKDRYYQNKFKPELEALEGTLEERIVQLKKNIKDSYIRGLCWVLQYYYKGCQSWKWFYEFHYAPFASDLRNIEDTPTHWGRSVPFKPFEQLMAVLPPASSHALPQVCRFYMEDQDSEIADFYPLDFEYDPNGKQVRWLWIALLPFIDERRLMKVTKSLEPKYNARETKRNSFGPDVLIIHEDSLAGSKLKGILSQQGLVKNPPPLEDVVYEEKEEDETKEDAFVPKTTGDVRGGGANLLTFSAPDTGGLGGFVLQTETEEFLQPQKAVQPWKKKGKPIVHNQCLSCEFRLPPMMPHISQLLEGVDLPRRTLTQEDLRVRTGMQDRNSINVSTLYQEMNLNQHLNSQFVTNPQDLSHSRTGVSRGWGGQRSYGAAEPRMAMKTQQARQARQQQQPYMPPQQHFRPPQHNRPQQQYRPQQHHQQHQQYRLQHHNIQQQQPYMPPQYQNRPVYQQNNPFMPPPQQGYQPMPPGAAPPASLLSNLSKALNQQQNQWEKNNK